MKQPYMGPGPGDTRQCPNCGTGNDESARFCDSCGNVIPGPAAQYAQMPGDVIMCPVCNSYGEDNANYCSQCGHPLPISAFLSDVGAYGEQWGEPVSSSGRPGELVDGSAAGRARYLRAMKWQHAGEDGRTTDELISEADAEAADAERDHRRALDRYYDWEQYENDHTPASEAYGVELQRVVFRTQRLLDQAQARRSARLAWRNDDFDGLSPIDRER